MGEIPVYVWRSGNQGCSGGEGWSPSSTVRRRVNSIPLHLFLPFSPSTYWMMPTDIRGLFALLSPPIPLPICSRNRLTDTSRSKVPPVIWASLGLFKSAHKMNCHSPQESWLSPRSGAERARAQLRSWANSSWVSLGRPLIFLNLLVFLHRVNLVLPIFWSCDY